MRRAIIAGLALLAIAAGGGVYWYVFERTGAAPVDPGAQAAAAGFAIPVAAGPVKIDTVERMIRAVGSLRSDESVIISPEISGRLEQIPVKEGERISAGTLIAVLDSDIYEADLADAKARLTLSQANHERAKSLRQTGAGTVRALDEAVAQLLRDQAAVQLAQARLDKTRITAPFDGVLGMRQVSAGSYLDPGDPIINLEAIDTLKVDFRIAEIYLEAVRVGQSIEIELDALPGRTYAGEVYAIDPLVDTAGRSIVIRARLPNRDGALRPGLFARVALVIERRENAILVPEQALVAFGDDQFVYRVVDGKAKMTAVKIGERRSGDVEITDGLAKDDVVISEGQMKVQDGAPVSIVPEDQSGAGQSS
jgi:membrane fusion protein, multidrug efflux system